MTSREVVRKELDAARGAGRSVGFVPTMGALHKGHLSLIRRASADCDVTAVSIFVNPLQFGSADDLENYPRDLDSDRRAAYDAGAELVFAPTVEEMYSEADTTRVRVGGVSDRLEGASRPGHFDGVATVVAKLFNVAGACRAYFGEKDYQQLLVIERMVADLSFPVDVVACPTVRENDGLACSSRNPRLGAADRSAASVLYRALAEGVAAIEAGERRAGVVREIMSEAIATEKRAVPDYVEVADPATLEPLSTIASDARLLVAARFGEIRLIDNLGVVI
ncbi:MAG: pantoate--beta-alanine ligase [Actinomycetota bacterium]|nr:pantoate--beta-alanine ligase [Actinomycetota bacterium]